MNDLVSVIIPIYNVEKYLERCVKSVIRQTYQKLEIVLVDDGSPDGCGEICERLAKEDARIKVYHKENGGLSDARNYGVQRSTGQYIAFIDSDDYVSTEYIEYLVTLLEKNDADISCCCMVETEGDSVTFCRKEELPNEMMLTGRGACGELFRDLYLVLVTACGKIYRKEIVMQYPFPVGKKHEDEATTCKYYYASKKVVLGNQCLYAYYQNMDSITHTKGNGVNSDAVWALTHRAEFFEQQNEIHLAQVAWNKLFGYYVANWENDERKTHLLKGFGKGKTLSLRTRIGVILYNIAPFLYYGYDQICKKLGQMKRKM